MTEVQVIALMAAILYEEDNRNSPETCRDGAITQAINIYADAKAAIVVAPSDLRA